MKRVQNLMVAFIASIASLVCVNAGATLINFTEDDLSADFSRPFTINMAGTNTWRGTSSYDSGQGSADVDTFLLTIAPGFAVVSMDVVLSSITVNGGDGPGGTFEEAHQTFIKDPGTLSTLVGVRFDLSAGPGGTIIAGDSINFPLGGPLGPGNYNVAAAFPSNDGQDDNASWSWQLNLVSRAVTTVPEPTTLALMTLGVAGIGYSKKRKAA